jgi:CDP-diacylglycerol--serine O-phosphatidyltransferase
MAAEPGGLESGMHPERAPSNAAPLNAAKGQPRRGMYVLPSLFTAGNIAFGFYAMTQSIQGSNQTPWFFDHAALAIGFAVLFDGLDGKIARATNTASAFGRELDSLADVITFGVAPAMLAYIWGFQMLPELANPLLRQRIVQLGVGVCFLFLICGASRLARFNVSVNPQPKNPGRPGSKYFVGMPIPAGAGVIAAVVHCFNGSPIDDWRIALVWTGLIMLTGFLMVSSWRFWSGKEVEFEGRRTYRLFALIALIGVLIWMFSEVVLMIIALGYLVSGVIARLAYSWQRGRRRPVSSTS